jgi:signal transduction histidine kinase
VIAPVEILARVRDLAAGLARAAEVGFDAPDPDGPLPAVSVCPSEIESAIFNLVSNAFDAVADGGRVTVTVAAADDDGRLGVAWAVRDDGPGIAGEHLDRIFEPFFTTKPPGKGTGLGLPIVRQIVDVYGGRVDVASSPGGTTVRLWIPAHDAAGTRG